MGIEYYVFALFIAALVSIVAIIIKVLFSNVKMQNKLLDERETKILQTYNSIETIMEEFQDQAKSTIDELKLREQEYRAALNNIAAFELPAKLEKKEQIIERIPRTGSLPVDAGRIRAAGEVIERAERLINYETRKYADTGSQELVSGMTAPPAARSAAPPAPQPRFASPVPRSDTFSTAAAPPAAVPVNPLPSLIPEPKPPPAKPTVFQKFFDDAADAPPPTPYSPAPVNGGSRRDSILALAGEGKSDVEIASQLGITRNEVQLVIGLTAK